MNKIIKILLVDDHAIIRDGIKAILRGVPDIKIIGEANNGAEAIELIKENAYHLVMIDVNMPVMNGIEATKYISKHYPALKILALTMYEDKNYILEMLENGASGYLIKNINKKELINALRSVAKGEKYYSEKASAILIEHMVNDQEKPYPKKPKKSILLTKRELEILQLITAEYNNQEIADKLNISQRTVDTHRRNAMQKLNVKNTAGLVKSSIKLGLIE